MAQLTISHECNQVALLDDPPSLLLCVVPCFYLLIGIVCHFMTYSFCLVLFRHGKCFDMEFLCECPHDQRWAHPGSDSTLQPHTESPDGRPSSPQGYRRYIATGERLHAARSLSICTVSKDPIVPGEWEGLGGEGAAKESHEARPPGQRLPRRWALGTLPKTTRRRGSQTQSISVWSAVAARAGTLPLFSSAVWKKRHTVT